MSDKVDTWQMEIASITWEFEKITKNIGIGDLNFKPRSTSWSIAENLSHLIRVNSSYYPIFDQVLNQSYTPPIIAKIPFLATSIGKMLYSSMGSKAKVRTFAIWEPTSDEYPLDILADFSNRQMELSTYIQNLEPYFDPPKIIHSPASKLLVYQLDKAIDIIIAHEKRHLQQCKNILEVKNKPWGI